MDFFDFLKKSRWLRYLGEYIPIRQHINFNEFWGKGFRRKKAQRIPGKSFVAEQFSSKKIPCAGLAGLPCLHHLVLKHYPLTNGLLRNIIGKKILKILDSSLEILDSFLEILKILHCYCVPRWNELSRLVLKMNYSWILFSFS